LRILIVDDEPGFVTAMVEVLSSLGHQAAAANSGTEALEIIAADRPWAILCDLRMPGLDGPALYAEVCARNPELADMFVFVTGDTLSEDVRRFLETVNAPFIAKPFQIGDLRAALGALVER
jgi:two-component system NtrC family sensor kinase